ncbi:MAG TPA: ATP-binding protein [Bryobacteraceae bacterium]|nr:ATP-binding protein [Bryobacteraceae bacterium]
MPTQVKGREARIQDLRSRLEEAEATIRAIYAGEIDAVVVRGPLGPQVYTLEGADHPYRVLVEQMHEGTVTLDRNGVVLYSNSQFAALVGSPPDSIAGSRFDRFLGPFASNTFVELSEAAATRGHSSGQLELASGDGCVVPVRISLTLMDVSGMQTTCLVVSDLREQRRNEAIVREEQLSRMILDQAGEAIVVVDLEGVVVRLSESAKSLAVGPALLNVFDSVFPLTSGGSRINAARIFYAARAGQRIRGLEAALVQPDATTRSVLLSAGPLWSQYNELLGCVVTLTDITERKQSEEALARQAHELALVNSDLRQFAHSASHDLREPLRQLAVFSELLQKAYEEKLDARGVQLIQHTVEASRRAESLLKGLLEYTQAAGAPLEVVKASDPNEIVRATLETFENRIAETRARVDTDSLPPLAVHEFHLTQLFQNLIGNALKYRGEDPPVIQIRAEAMDDWWKISVADNGIGIGADYREQVFGLFQRLHGGGKYSGSGIGLAICQKIVQRYGGRIWVESEPGRGCTFQFTLPGMKV